MPSAMQGLVSVHPRRRRDVFPWVVSDPMWVAASLRQPHPTQSHLHRVCEHSGDCRDSRSSLALNNSDTHREEADRDFKHLAALVTEVAYTDFETSD